jgi:hypothetical protein
MSKQINNDWEFIPIDCNKIYTLPSGKYYIGDICNPLGELPIYENIYGNNEYKNGLYKSINNEIILVDEIVDEHYNIIIGSDNNEYLNSSSTIGIVSYSLCANDIIGGHVYEFKYPINVTINNGIFTFTSDNFTLVINTEIKDYE